MTPAETLPYAFLAWLALTFGTYAGIRAYHHRRGEPEGWRFNHHGAHAFPGHLSFYPREGNDSQKGVVLRSVTLFPLFWKVREGRSRSDLETVRRGPVWSVIPWAYRWMSGETSDGDEDGGRGLICMFCGADHFQTQDDLEDHIDSHPYTARRGDADD